VFFYAIFGLFFSHFATINFLEKSKCAHHAHTRRHLCAKFDILKPSQS